VPLNVSLLGALYRVIILLVNDGTDEYLFGGIEMEETRQHDQLMSVTEAAKRLGGVSKWTVHAWLSQGKLQRTKVGGRTMIRESELDKVIQVGGKSPIPKRGKEGQ
jgi:excisionase family DNA binding protein